MDYEDIVYKEENGIVTMTLNRPDKMNAFSPGMQDSMYRVVERVAQEKSIRVLIITGAGRGFCSGADVRSLAEQSNRPERPERAEQAPSGRINLHILMQKCPKPIIAAVNGAAVGAGCDLALACDIRIASDQARFAEIYIRRGIVPAMGGTYFLPRIVGIAKACELIWTGDMIDANEAERIGLVSKVVPHEELESTAMELAEKLAGSAPLVIQATKRAIYAGLDMDLETTMQSIQPMMREASQSGDRREGAQAFLEKREPLFRGE